MATDKYFDKGIKSTFDNTIDHNADNNALDNSGKYNAAKYSSFPRIAIAQINPTMGDLVGNATKIIRYIEKAKQEGAEIVVFPEQAVTGYPAMDNLLHEDFIEDVLLVNQKIAEQVEGITAIVGSIERSSLMIDGKYLYNSALVIKDGKIIGSQQKTLLPNYDVFHELRYFIPAQETKPIEIAGHKIGIQICEDMWDHDYRHKITDELVTKGAEMIINISASPNYIGKKQIRFDLIKEHAKSSGVPFLYANMIGGQDELVFDGGSMCVMPDGKISTQLPQFEECLRLINFEKREDFVSYIKEEDAFLTLKLGLGDYFRKNGLTKAVLGSSGGIDSAMTAVIAAEALGAKNVLGISLPSEFSTTHSIDDAKTLAKRLGIKYDIVPIGGMYESVMKALESKLEGKPFDVTEENIQARLRMITLMAYTNKHGYTLLCTGDKSEIALGYYTLYGDGAGGISVLSDITKPELYEIARWYNAKHGKEIIPSHILTKPPSPELKPGQFAPFDYNRLSPLIEEMTERVPLRKLLEKGFSGGDIKDVYKKWRMAEFKRWQSPIALKCKKTSFGKGRMYPVTNRYVPSAMFEM